MLKQPSSARLKRRYILVKGTKEQTEKALMNYLGVLGWGRAGPVIETYGNEVVIAVNREELVHVKAGLVLSAHSLEILRVSGTLKGLKKHKA